MKQTSLSLAALLLALAGCTGPGAEPPAPSGGTSAGAAGPGYCETVPSNPEDMAAWNKVCSPGRP